MKKNLLACALCAFSLPALAEGFYAAGELGQAKWKVDSESKNDTAFGVAGGYKFNDIFAVELGYRDLGGVSESDEDGKVSVDFTALQLSVIANAAINDKVGIYGRLGMADLKLKVSVPGDSASDSKNKAVFGVGAGYAVSQTVSLFVEYDQYAKYEDLKISTFSVGAKFQF